MQLVDQLTEAVFGNTPRIRRVMHYWAATAVLYGFCAGVVLREVAAGTIAPWVAHLVASCALGGSTVFYVLLRCAPRLGIPNWRLALSQAQFAIVFELLLFGVLDKLGSAILIGMPVVIVFCAFSLRPRQTVMLSAFAIGGLALTMTTVFLVDPARHTLHEQAVFFAVTTFGMAAATVITRELHKLRKQLVDAVATIRTLATTDDLTLLANRRHMRELLAVEEQRRSACPHHVCVALIDIDFFKSINDRYGHAAGDAVLRSFAREAGATLRSADTLARWGGEEFLLLMPDTMLDEAMAVIGRIVARVGAMPVDATHPELRITFSAGVAASLPLERFDEAIQRADEAMYRAKASGRNCVIAA